MRTLFFTCLLTLSFTASAQIDAKLNFGQAITGGIGVAAEFGLSYQSSLSGGLSYATTKANVDFGSGSNEYKYARFRVIPEYRFYVSPDYGADRFFVGAYGKVVLITASSDNDPDEYDFTRGVLGILTGYKWVTDSGLMFELNAGVGGGKLFNDDKDDVLATRVLGAVSGIDARLGLIVGYRF